MSAPTAAELKALNKFRSKVTDLGLENERDLSMLRWIRVCELNLENAEQMLRKHMKWSQDEKICEILDWIPPEMIKENYQFEVTGQDEIGRPICIIPFGNWDIRKAVKSGNREQFFRNIDLMFAQLFAKMEANFLKFNREITECVLIVDFANFSLAQLKSVTALNTLVETVRRVESNYPEIMHRIYVVNSTRAFQIFFSLVKPLLSARTTASVQIYTGPDTWIPVLQASLPKDQIPPEFGGNRS